MNYVTNAQGQIMSRVESSAAPTNPEDYYYYYFNGEQIGAIGNDGASQTDYAQAIAQRGQAASGGAFANTGGSPVAYANFGDAYAPTGPTSQGSATQANGVYTVQAGDTLQSIALAQRGDASLWYLIADANGLGGGAALTAGTTLIIPSKVVDIHDNAATFTVYDPSNDSGYRGKLRSIAARPCESSSSTRTSPASSCM